MNSITNHFVITYPCMMNLITQMKFIVQFKIGIVKKSELNHQVTESYQY